MEKVFIVTRNNQIEWKDTRGGGPAIYKHKKLADNYINKLTKYGYGRPEELKVVELNIDIEQLRKEVA